MKQSFLLGCGLAALTGASPVLAQSSAQALPNDTAYYSAHGQQLRSRAGAARLLLLRPVAAGGFEQRIYNPAGRLLEQISVTDASARLRAGLAQSWYPDGRLKGRRRYQNGQLDGQQLLFYPDGTVQQLAFYQQGELKSRQCFAASGQPETCPSETQQGRVYASYQFGRDGLATEIRNRLRYPRLPAGTEPRPCRVIVACTVGIDGRLQDQRLYKSAGEPYDAEALRVISALRGTWKPQLLDGEPEESVYAVEVDFLPPPR